MADPQTHTIKKMARKDKPVLLNQLFAALLHLLELLDQKPRGITTGLRVKKLPVRLLRRLSPFLLAALFSPVLFIYWFVAGEDINRWLLVFLFVVSEVNLFYADVVLWKYFTREKTLRIWLIEIFLILIIGYFLV